MYISLDGKINVWLCQIKLVRCHNPMLYHSLNIFENQFSVQNAPQISNYEMPKSAIKCKSKSRVCLQFLAAFYEIMKNSR